MITKYCASNHARIEKFEQTVQHDADFITKKMGNVGHLFMAGAKKDIAAWDCEEMYPEPKEIDLGVPDWLGGITRLAKKGFEVYNMVKKFIPGGSTAGAGNVPGSKSEELVELVEWGQVKETAVGLGKKLLDDMEKDQKKKSDNLKARRKIWL